MGYDVHKLVEGRDLIIGGVKIPHTLGLLGHSDADVLLHAIMDALLGAAALGDIGKHFPDTDPKYKGSVSEYRVCAFCVPVGTCGGTDRRKRLYCGKYRCDDHRTETKDASAYRTDGEEYCSST